MGPLTIEEQEHLNKFKAEIRHGEEAQVHDLIFNCNNKYQFAKTHSQYVKDWETTRRQMLAKVANNMIPGVSQNLGYAMVGAADRLIEAKLQKVREAFLLKFGESIYNYLGKDGKTKFLGLF